MGISVESKGVTRDYKIMFRRGGEHAEVQHLFDAAGSETFDPTEAVEAFVGTRSFVLRAGDALVFELE